MSDEKNINWRPPMKAPQTDYSKMLLNNLKQINNSEWMKNSVWNNSKKVKTNSSSANVSTEAKKLHKDWKLVMEKEAEVDQNKIKIDPDISLKFFDEITKTAKRINCRPDDLAAIIYRESHFDPQVKSSSGKYTGLIQMDKMSFDSINVDKKCTYEQYTKLPREKQIKYSEAYLKFRIEEKGLTGKKLTGGQVYTLIRRPKDINNPSVVRRNQKYVDKAKQVPSQMKKIDTKM